MNDHSGWDSNGRCVRCFSKDPSTKCLDPYSDEFKNYILNLEYQLRKAQDDRDWWMKKHQEDTHSMRIIARREGAHLMKSKLRDLVWAHTYDEYLDVSIAELEHEEDHYINCEFWRDFKKCSCNKKA